MSGTVKVALGWNNTGGLADISPQPAWTPGQWAKVDAAVSGGVGLQGKYYKLDCSVFDQPDWFSVLAQCGLNIDSAINYTKVTVQFPNEQNNTTTNYNAYSRYMGDGARSLGEHWKTAIYIVSLNAI